MPGQRASTPEVEPAESTELYGEEFDRLTERAATTAIQPGLMVFEGNIYQVRNTVYASVEEALRLEYEKWFSDLRSSLRDSYGEMRQRCARELQQARSGDRTTIQPHDYMFMLRNQITVGLLQDNYISLIIPLKYAPQRVDNIPIINPDRLERDVLMMVGINGHGHLQCYMLLRKDTFGLFYNYHGTCTGTYRWPPTIGLDNIVTIRDQLQTLYQELFRADMPSPNPGGGDLPPVSSIRLRRPTRAIPNPDVPQTHIPGVRGFGSGGIWDLRDYTMRQEERAARR